MIKVLFLMIYIIFHVLSIKKNALKKNNIHSRNFESNTTKTQNFDFINIKANCFVNVNRTVYDILPLYDSELDYTLNSGLEDFYFNFCNLGNTKCKKDKSYIISSTSSPINNTLINCYELSGSKTKLAKWKIFSK